MTYVNPISPVAKSIHIIDSDNYYSASNVEDALKEIYELVGTVTGGLDWQSSVLDKDLTAPPATPSDGDRYIIAAGATGDWTGHDNDLTQYDGDTSSWDFMTPNEGTACWVEDEDTTYVFNGTSWVKLGTTISHSNLANLGADDHSQYVHISTARTITAQHSFSPSVVQAPFVLGANAQGQLVSGLNADQWDGNEFADYLNQAVRTSDIPTFAGLSINGNITTTGILTTNDFSLNGVYIVRTVQNSQVRLSGGDLFSFNPDSIHGSGIILYGRDSGCGDVRLCMFNGLQSDGLTPTTGAIRFHTINEDGTYSEVATLDSSGNFSIDGDLTVSGATDGAISVANPTIRGINNTVLAIGEHSTGGEPQIEFSDATDSGAIKYNEATGFEIYVNGGTTWTRAMLIESNKDITLDGNLAVSSGRIGIGRAPQGFGAMVPKLDLFGAYGTGTGPHITCTIDDTNDVPSWSLLNYNHDNINMMFDAYWDGTNWVSSDDGSNYGIIKGNIAVVGANDRLAFVYSSGVAIGGAITWNVGAYMDTSGAWTFNKGLTTTSVDASNTITISMASPNDLLRLKDLDTDDYWAFRLTAADELTIDYYDSSAATHFYPLYLYPGTGNIKLTYDVTVGGDLFVTNDVTTDNLWLNYLFICRNVQNSNLRIGGGDNLSFASNGVHGSGMLLFGRDSGLGDIRLYMFNGLQSDGVTPTSGAIRFYTVNENGGGIERAVLDSNGNLQIDGDLTVSGDLFTSDYYLTGAEISRSVQNSELRFSGGDKFKFETNGIHGSGIILYGRDTGYGDVRLYMFNGLQSDGATPTSGAIRFYTIDQDSGTIERAVLDSSGNLQIDGTMTVSGADLLFDSGARIKATAGTTDNLVLDAKGSGVTYINWDDGSGGVILSLGDGVNYASLTSAGNWYVRNNIDTTTDLHLMVGGTSVAYFDSSGNFEINGDHISGASEFRIQAETATPLVVRNTDADATIYSAGTAAAVYKLYYSYLVNRSSIKYKFDVVDVNIDYLSNLFDRLRIRQYKRKTSKNETEFGFVAEEMPDEVQGKDKDGKIIGYDVNKLITLLVAKIKILERKIIKLEGVN